jgi:predicted small lipoprotein YifL
MKVCTSALLAAMFAAGCAARGPLNQPPSPIVPTAHDRALARNVLELEGHSFMIPMSQLDSLAPALARLRSVDSVVAAELAHGLTEGLP